jgi:hypothetical protein|uniref:Uncharacterized protein n=1 Tax=Fagus sylvatica TaxID=28930 RepID=A0A2N9H2U8_FAGSY
MGIKKWLNPRSESIQLGRSYEQSNYNNKTQTQPVWHVFWKKIKRDKKKFPSSHITMQANYDPETYSKNFDKGMGSLEPDNLSRSFSARFADPSSVLRMHSLLDLD